MPQPGQTVERRINPGVQGNVGRPEFGWGARARWFFFLEIFLESVRARTRQFRVVMRPVDIPADQIAEDATDDHVGGEVLPSRDPRNSDSRGSAVGHQFDY